MTRLRSGTVGAGDTATAVPSAGVLLVRDGVDGALEVFMQERTLRSDFAGGALVFPGGKVDAQDRAMPTAMLGPIDGVVLQRALGTATTAEAVALAVAAVREAFEEAGVLLARRDGRLVDADELRAPGVVAMRAALADRHTSADWRPFLEERGLVLDLAALVPWAWWITPHGIHRRYSARFFLSPVPAGQATLLGHDGAEMTDSTWLRPRAALAAADAAERTIIYPTRRTLVALADHATVADAVGAARRGEVDLRPIVPVLRRLDDSLGVQHPDGGPVEVV